MFKTLISFIVLIGGFQYCYAQEVEHNYLVGPQTTSCDSLKFDKLSLNESIKRIRAVKFRFDQSFKLTRKQGLQAGEYFSCDNKTGYMVIKYGGIEHLYESVEKELWHELISSSDPEGFYITQKKILQERMD